jgi:hypothetical protein
MRKITILLLSLVSWTVSLPAGPIDIVRLKYGGGGDWYNDPAEETNLLKEFSVRTGVEVNAEKISLSAADDDLFLHPLLFITGHGEIKFTSREAERLRLFLTSGGFLYADDDYGMDQSFRREIKRVFPESELQELSSDFPLFSCYYDLSAGLPKIHEHDQGQPRSYGLFYRGRLVVLYTFNTNISDGWTNDHNDPAEKREEAVKIGVNILWYALTRP